MNKEQKPHLDAIVKTEVIGEVFSSVSAMESLTELAPSYVPRATKLPPLQFNLGDRIGDFEIIRELGKGGFATVFLARQLSLVRQVALKIGPNRGREAQTLASLEHDHIVHVFSETVDEGRQTRLLCMQYVPGATLADVMKRLPVHVHATGTGRDFLTALDQVCGERDEFRPSALVERETLAAGSFHEAVCWIGAKLSGALEFAHDCGVLHRDIKPANILLNAYGRPYLADFNLATHADHGDDVLLGGTIPYMSPEHLRAFASGKETDWKVVDARSDLYALGVVLYELATGKRPYLSDLNSQTAPPELQEQMKERLIPASSMQSIHPGIPTGLDQIIRKCIAPEPSNRFGSARELRQSLEDCRTQICSLGQLPPPPRFTGFLHAHPFLSMLLIATFTNLLASLVNISYNLIHIVGDLTLPQQNAFHGLLLIYNIIAFPLLIGISAWLVHRGHRSWVELHDGRMVSTEDLTKLCRQYNFQATWSIIGTLIGWLPGGPLFPLVIHYFGEPITFGMFFHFLLSFTISGMIAITYCYLGSQYVVLRVLLPRLSAAISSKNQSLNEQLQRVSRRLVHFQILAGVIPLTGALMILLIQPATQGFGWFRILVSLLIMLGMLGFVLSLRISQYLQRTLNILLNPERRER